MSYIHEEEDTCHTYMRRRINVSKRERKRRYIHV
jgi:hypothetical protein